MSKQGGQIPVSKGLYDSDIEDGAKRMQMEAEGWD